MILPGSTLGERIKFRRENMGMLQKHLAKLTGIHVNTIARVEKDIGEISAIKLQLICIALDIKMDTLMPKVPYEVEFKIRSTRYEPYKRAFPTRKAVEVF